MSATTENDGPRTGDWDGAARGGDRLTGPEAAELSGRIADLTRAGLPLASSLRALAEELPRGRLRRSMDGLAGQLELGRPLSEAIEHEGRRVPPHLRGLVLAAAPRQRLGEMLARFSIHVEAGQERRRRVWLALAYPFVLIALEIAILMGISLVVAPRFEAIFRDFGVPLSALTIMVLIVCRAAAKLGPALLLLGALLAALALLTRWLSGPGWPTALVARVPVLGGVWRWTSLAEFFHLLGLLLENEVPMSESLRLAGEGVQNAELSIAGRRMAASVDSGQPLALAMAASPRFPAGLPRLLLWGERQGGLPEMLHLAGEMCEARADAQASTLRSIAAVLSVVLMVWCAFMLGVGLMLPLLSLIHKLSG